MTIGFSLLNDMSFFQDFCEHGEQWPPTEEMHLLLGSKGDSCKDTCAKNGMTLWSLTVYIGKQVDGQFGQNSEEN